MDEKARVAKVRKIIGLHAKLLGASETELALVLYIQILHFGLEHKISAPCMEILAGDCLSIGQQGLTGMLQIGELFSGTLDHSECEDYCPLREVMTRYENEGRKVN